MLFMLVDKKKLTFQKVVRISSQDHEDWEIYEETFNHKTNEKRQTPPTKNMEVRKLEEKTA